MNYKYLLRLIGRAVAFGSLLSWFIIFLIALLFSENRMVRVTLNPNKLHEFWFEFALLIVGMVGWLYDYYCRKRLEDTKKDREQVKELVESSTE